MNLTSGTYNTYVGSEAGNGSGTTSGGSNVGVGYASLYSNSTGASNTAVGLWALFTNNTGSTNTAVGGYALRYNTSGTGGTSRWGIRRYATTKPRLLTRRRDHRRY